MCDSRRKKIEAMLADDPRDEFLRYSLALELQKEGDHETSLEGLKELSQEEPPYVPAFFMAAQQLVGLARFEEAQTCLREGICQARLQNDMHAVEEMGQFLASLPSD